MLQVQKDLRRLSKRNKALTYAWFFKAGPGEYGEGDKFIGVTVPETRRLAKANLTLTFGQLKALLQSEFHEERLLALMVLVENYQRSKIEDEKQRIVDFYLKSRKCVDNWDLVDLSAYKILGDHCLSHGKAKVLRELSTSKRHWDRRIAIVATFAFIRQRQLDLTFELAQKLLADREDLMHKACGWMLREAGKRDRARLVRFISAHGRQMPRTMLRYSIEKFSLQERQRFLIETRAKTSPKVKA